MANLTKALVILSALGFVLAVALALMGGSLLGVTTEGYSRACTNLALLAIALSLTSGKKGG
ncbi:MAG TPA: hypothetical protein VM492_18165 [Sumerlaeia bacterium]|nr:hypothetical protein [Sumerlaeia bacterium]